MRAALREIAGDLGEPEQLAGFVAQRGNDDVRPEARAVLADTPVLVLEPAERRRLGQLVLRPAARDLIVRIEARKVSADDLRSGVSLDPAGAFAPSHDLPR